LFTADGVLNRREQAETMLARTLPLSPDPDFAKTKRYLRRPQTLTYLDEVHRQLTALPSPDLREAAVRWEEARRRPDRLQGDSPSAAARRAVRLACTALLATADQEGAARVQAVRSLFRTAWRASSLVEGINSMLRRRQARRRRPTPGLLDRKRLYWNGHRFRTGRRRDRGPYERLGLRLPKDWI
jgi:hypothetical protein